MVLPCNVYIKLLYPSIRVRTAPPVSVRVRARVDVSFSFKSASAICTQDHVCGIWDHCSEFYQNFCIQALGSGQRILYRLGSGIELVSVLVLRFCASKLIFKLISGKEFIADCAPSFELVRRRKIRRLLP